MQCLDKHAPKTSCNIVYRERPDWMDHEYVLARAKRRRLERVYKRFRTLHNKNCQVQQTKLCNAMVKEKRKVKAQNDVISCAGDQKALFNLL